MFYVPFWFEAKDNGVPISTELKSHISRSSPPRRVKKKGVLFNLLPVHVCDSFFFYYLHINPHRKDAYCIQGKASRTEGPRQPSREFTASQDMHVNAATHACNIAGKDRLFYSFPLFQQWSRKLFQQSTLVTRIQQAAAKKKDLPVHHDSYKPSYRMSLPPSPCMQMHTSGEW